MTTSALGANSKGYLFATRLESDFKEPAQFKGLGSLLVDE